MITEIKFKKLYPSTVLPEKAHPTDIGYDLKANIEEHYGKDYQLVIPPVARILIKCGFAMELPVGWEAQIRPRSGLALKQGITVLNSPATIDPNFRGECGVILVNLGKEEVKINHNDRIAQMVFSQVPEVKFKIVEELSESDRGLGGFGSTGK